MAQSSDGRTAVWPKDGGVSAASSGEQDDIEGPPANFSCLTLTNDNKHLVAVTAEDKAIRVFELDQEFNLKQLSKRCMSKRPCSITLTADDSTILCADKFGDVYALPLIPPPNDGQEATPAPEEQKEETYVPAASVLTVHSGRNRKVLEEQMKQKAKGVKKVKETPSFKHELLLGHVSMLTSIAYTTMEGRQYIITGDRDEHIRISRGPPQAHIIEGFCHGHEAFVNSLCLTKSGQLVSGGGDPYLFVWDWLQGQLKQQLNIREAVYQFLKSQPDLASTLPEDENNFRIAVTGIWSVPASQSNTDEILVTCENVPALFGFSLGGFASATQTIPLKGNALDVTIVKQSPGASTAVVSVDSLHIRGSTTETRKDEVFPRLQFFSYQQSGQWQEDEAGEQKFQWFSRDAGRGEQSSDEKAIRDILYGAENLRKRPGQDEE